MEQMREFGKAADLQAAKRREAELEAEQDADPVIIKVAGRPITLRYPGTGDIVLLTMMMADTGPRLIVAGRILDFVVNLMKPDDKLYILDLIKRSRDTGFTGMELVDIAKYLLEEWVANPTDEPPASSRSESSGTPRSTAASRRTPADRRSPSTRRGSTTSSTPGA
jgi:hypothetical protein